jgi:alpha-galactosidase
MKKFFAFCCLLQSVFSIDNGKGITPPMGWRSWNLFGADVDQELIISQMNGMMSKKRTVNGVPTSLYDLGYNDVGLDDAWQLCGHYGSKKWTYHDESGNPVVNTALFPDFNAMTDYAHSLGLTAGWYGNNCICRDHCSSTECYQADVKALVGYGFDSVKLDGCGLQLDLSLWANLINQTGKAILIENCHWGNTVPTKDYCPWNYYRTSGDVRASYDSVLSNLMTTVPFATKNLSTPGCWAYPDMLEVGCAHGPGGESDPGLSFVEARTHFGAWCIVSSPLILSHDTNNDTISDEIWPIISNTEAISVNQAWAGDSGSLFASSDSLIQLRVPISARSQSDNKGLRGVQEYRTESTSSWQQWSKRLGKDRAAVLIMNNANAAQTISVSLNKIPVFASMASPPASYQLRSVWDHADLGTFSGEWTVTLEKHDSAFLIVSSA